jgi:UPF0716 protein FxsA
MMVRRGWALLPLGLLLLVVAEIAVFIAVAHAIGGGWALLIMVVASLLGIVLLRREGVRGWRRFRAAAEAGRPPGDQVSHSLVGLLGALLLAMPGFITAVAGLLLLAPPVRALARHGVTRTATRRLSGAMAGDVFGPRRVRVRRGAPDHVPDQEVPVDTAAPAVEGEVVEGEIVK